jgi:hypothetical protein
VLGGGFIRRAASAVEAVPAGEALPARALASARS